MPYHPIDDVPASDYGWNEWAKIAGGVLLWGGLASVALIAFVVMIPIFLILALVQLWQRL